MTAAATLTGTELLEVVQNGSSRRTTAQDIANLNSSDVELLTSTVEISSAEILNLNSSPKTLIAAPGAGKLISIQSMVIQYNYITAPYTTNTTLSIRLGTNTMYNNVTILDQTINQYTFGVPNSQTTSDPINQPVVVTVNAGNPTDGSGTLKVFLTYRIITV